MPTVDREREEALSAGPLEQLNQIISALNVTTPRPKRVERTTASARHPDHLAGFNAF